MIGGFLIFKKKNSQNGVSKRRTYDTPQVKVIVKKQFGFL